MRQRAHKCMPKPTHTHDDEDDDDGDGKGNKVSLNFPHKASNSTTEPQINIILHIHAISSRWLTTNGIWSLLLFLQMYINNDMLYVSAA